MDAAVCERDDAGPGGQAQPWVMPAVEVVLVTVTGPMLLETPDYDRAVDEFVRRAIHGLMSHAAPTYAAMNRRKLPEGVDVVEVQVAGQTTVSPNIAASQLIGVDYSDVIEGNLEELHAILAQIADSLAPQVMIPIFDHIAEAAKAVGNAVDAEDRPLSWDLLLELMERAEWRADDAGQVQLPTLTMHPDVLKRLQKIPLTSANAERLESIAQRKQEEHVSRRRSRRLR
jgi:hypothetical protein